MLSYRSLQESDCDFILQNWVGHSIIFRKNNASDKDKLLSLIRKINTKQHNGNYFEMFGITHENTLVGTFSFYQRETDIPENAVYFGIEIDKDNRGKGFATSAVLMAFQLASEKGYEKVYSQASVENIASVKLHNKCEFDIIERIINRKGNEVYNFVKVL